MTEKLQGKDFIPFLNSPQLLQDSLDLLAKLKKIREFVGQDYNAADILLAPKNYSQLENFFGADVQNGLKLFLNYAVADAARIEFNQVKETLQNTWMVKFAKSHADVQFTVCVEAEGLFWLGNPSKHENLRSLQKIPSGGLVSLSAFKKNVPRGDLQKLLEDYRGVFEEQAFAGTYVAAAPTATAQVLESVEKPAATGVQSKKVELTIQKLDTFVHAGNATMIVEHLRKYKGGKMRLFVYREKAVEIDPYNFDALWSAQIKNGEEVAWIFPEKDPDPFFVKELLRCMTCYAQLDKANISG